MNGVEWFIIKVMLFSTALIVVFSLLFILKFERSGPVQSVFGLMGTILHNSNQQKKRGLVTSRLYFRASRERTATVFFIATLLLFSVIILNHYVSFAVVTSDSMAFTLQKGDLVLMQSITRVPAEGDIIQFTVPSRNLPVLHRVIGEEPIGYVTQGDFSKTPDDWRVKPSQIQAKAVDFFGNPIIIPEIGELFIVKTRLGNEFTFKTGVVNIFKVLALIIFILALLSLFESYLRPGY